MVAEHCNTLDPLSCTRIGERGLPPRQLFQHQTRNLEFMLVFQKQIYTHQCEPPSPAIWNCCAFKQHEAVPSLLITNCNIYMPERLSKFGVNRCKMKIFRARVLLEEANVRPLLPAIRVFAEGKISFLWPTRPQRICFPVACESFSHKGRGDENACFG